MKKFFNKAKETALMAVFGIGKALYSFSRGLLFLSFFMIAGQLILLYLFLKGLYLDFAGGHVKVENFFENINFKL